MKIFFHQPVAGLGLFFALALAVSAQAPPSPPNSPDADDAGDFTSRDWTSGHSGKNDRVQIFGSNQIGADEKVVGDAVAVMGSNTVEGAVSHDVVAVMGSNTIEGSVGHDAVAVMGQAVINGTVGHNVVAVMGSITLGPHAVVRGDVVSVGGSIHRLPGAIIRGRIVSRSYSGSPSGLQFGPWGPDMGWRYDRSRSVWGAFLAAYRRWIWLFTFCALAFYALLALAFPRAIRHCGDTLAQRPGVAILTTFLALLALPLLFLLLCVTVIGIPLAVGFLPLGVLASVLFGKAALYALIGRNVSRDRLHPALAVWAGGLLCALFYFFPPLGLLVSLFLSTLGFGCVIATLLFAARPAVSRVIAPPPIPPVPPAPPPFSSPSPASDSIPSVAVPPAAVSTPPLGEAPGPPPPVTTPPAAAALPPPPAAMHPSLSPTLPRASFWIRMGALFIDALIVGFGLKLLFLPALLIFPIFLFWSPRFLLLAVYGALMWKYKGTTIGGMICGLHVVRLDGRPIEWDTAIVRALGCLLSTAACFLGFIWIGIDDEKQAWHDKIAGTVVVRTKGISLV